MDAEHGRVCVGGVDRLDAHRDPAGYSFAVYRFRGKGVLYALVLGSVFVPTTVLAVPLYFMLSQSGLTNSLLA